MNDDQAAAPVLESHSVLGMRVDRVDYSEATERIIELARRRNSSGYVCVANVHMTMEAYDDPTFQRVVNSADLVVPDGMPLVWTMRMEGVREATRVRGPDLVLHVAEAASRTGIPVGFYGGRPDSLTTFTKTLRERFPSLVIACAIAPPFRPLSAEEDAEATERIVNSGARILFVGLGCPKQERWMATHRGRIAGAMIGVGAAFDIHSGRVPEAPVWFQAIGLEWLFRLSREPRRLIHRYAKHNPRYLALSSLQLIRHYINGGFRQ